MTQPPADGSDDGYEPPGNEGSDLASVVRIERREDIAGVCGRVDTAPTYAVVIHAPDGNRQLATELGIRRLQRHVESSGKVIAIATANVALASRARQAGIPVARRPEHVRWDSGGRHVFRFAGRSLAAPRVGRYVQAIIILAIAVIFVGLAVSMAPSATVVAYPPTDKLSKTVTITASDKRTDIDFTTLAVPARKVSARQKITIAIRTSGIASVGVQTAKVGIAITNPGTAAIAVPAHAVLLAGAAFFPFELDEKVAVAPGATIVTTATAQKAGTAGNVPSGAVAGWSDVAFRGLKVTNPDAAAGGINEDRQAVDIKDIVAIKQMAKDLQSSDALKRTLLESRPHDAVFLRTAESSAEFGEPVTPAGTPAEFLLLDVEVTVSALAVLEGTLDEIARHFLGADQGAGEFMPGTVTASETGARQVDTESGTISTELLLTGEFARNIKRDDLREAVLGRSVDGAKSTLKSNYGIQDADVSVSPGWMPWLPRFGFRVSVDLRSRAAEETNATKGTQTNAPTPTPATASASATARP